MAVIGKWLGEDCGLDFLGTEPFSHFNLELVKGLDSKAGKVVLSLLAG